MWYSVKSAASSLPDLPMFFGVSTFPVAGIEDFVPAAAPNSRPRKTPFGRWIRLVGALSDLMWRSWKSVESDDIGKFPWAFQVNYRGNPPIILIPWAKSLQVAVADGTVFIASYLGVSKRRRLLNHNDKTFSISSLNSQFQGSLLAKLDCARSVFEGFSVAWCIFDSSANCSTDHLAVGFTLVLSGLDLRCRQMLSLTSVPTLGQWWVKVVPSSC